MEIITRSEWGARAPRYRNDVRVMPTPELWLHHSVSVGEGPAIIRAIQDWHMDERGWSDIAYSFLIDPAGDVYEGRGAGISGGHTKDHNSISHAICMVGNFHRELPTTAALASLAELVRYGNDKGWWLRRITGPHRQAILADGTMPTTLCCGDDLVNAIPTINSLVTDEGDDPMFLPLEQADNRTQDVACLSILMNAAYGLALPTDGTWGADLTAAIPAHLGATGSSKDGTFVTGGQYGRLLVAVGAKGSGGTVDTALRAKYNLHKHAEGTTAAPRADDLI